MILFHVFIFAALLLIIIMKNFATSLMIPMYIQPQQVHLSLGEFPTEMIVTWSTWNDTNCNSVGYGFSSSNLQYVSQGYGATFVDGGNEKRLQYIHRANLNHLLHNTTYYYHVGCDMFGWSDMFWFRTFPEGYAWISRVVLYGDMGVLNAVSLPRLQEEAHSGLCNMIIHIGDFAYDMDWENARVGDEFMRQIEPIAAYVPYMTLPGNHEQKYNFSNYRSRFSMPGTSEGMFYSFNMGSIHFVAISTEYYYYIEYGLKLLIKQYMWLREDLMKANLAENRQKQPWIIIMGHRPMYCSNSNLDDCSRKNCLTRVGFPFLNIFGIENLMMEYKVDVGIWAHEHSYERSWPIYNYKVLNGSTMYPYINPRGPVHITTGSAGCRETHDKWIYPQPFWSAFRSMDYGYTRLMAYNASHLYIEQVSDDKDGMVIDKIWIVKYMKP